MLTKILYNLIKINQVLAVGEGEPAEGLPSPLMAQDIPTLINNIVSFLAFSIAPPVAALMFIYGAFQILTAAGNPEKIIVGKKTIIYTAVAYLIILISLGLTSIIKSILGAK